MNLPEPIKTSITDESFAGVTYHIRGVLVPELQIELSHESVMFEHHTLLWKETAVKIELRRLPGGVKRKIAGLDFFVTKRAGPRTDRVLARLARAVHPAPPRAAARR